MEEGSILIVEDDRKIWKDIQNALQSLYISVFTAETKDIALGLLKREKIILILLDLCLDDEDGMDILKFVRRQDRSIPILILSSLSDLDTRKKGFDIGADDYILKPFHPDELLMRVKRALKRSEEQNGQPAALAEILRIGGLSLNLNNRTVSFHGKEIVLRNRLFDILLLFMQNPNVVLKKEILRSTIWEDGLVDDNALTVQIHQLRKIITHDSADMPTIKTVPKMGYILEYRKG